MSVDDRGTDLKRQRLLKLLTNFVTSYTRLKINMLLSLCSYCECFAAGVYCVEPCSCQECFNKPIYEDTVLATRKQIESRNPLAFAPKVIRNSDVMIEVGVRK